MLEMIKTPTRTPGTKISPDLHGWIIAGLAKPGKTQAGLAKAIGITAQQASQLSMARRGVAADELAAVARYFDEPIPTSLLNNHEILQIPVVGLARAGVWIDGDGSGLRMLERVCVPSIQDERYVGMVQQAVQMSDRSMDRIIDLNTFVIYVPFRKARPSGPMNRDLVFVRRQDGARVEQAVWRILGADDRWELRTESDTKRNLIVKLSPSLTCERGHHERHVVLLGLLIGGFVRY